MRVATIDILVKTIHELYPVSFGTHQIPAFVEQFRSVLSGLDGDQLNAAWHKTMEGWKKKSGPTAADILQMHKSLSSKNRSSSGKGDLSFLDNMRKLDDDEVMDRRRIIADYAGGHDAGYATAQAEGWLWHLETQVWRAANYIAQRNRQRIMGLTVRPHRMETCEPGDEPISIQRALDFVPWFSVETIDGEDLIRVDQSVLRYWRRQAQTPGPEIKRAMTGSRAMKTVGDFV